MAYFVRVTASYSELETFFVSVPADTVVVYQHDEASQVHCHFYIVTSLKTDSLKVRLKKLKQFDKTQWSFKTARDDRCIRYMAKGKYEPKYVRGYSQDKINDFKADWKPEAKEKEKATVYDIAQEVYDAIKNNNYESDYEYYKAIISNAISVHHRYRKPFCEFSLSKVVETASTLSIKGVEILERRMLNKLSKYGL